MTVVVGTRTSVTIGAAEGVVSFIDEAHVVKEAGVEL